MKILVIGGTGLVGSYLVPKLLSNNYETIVLTRDEKKTPQINNSGAVAVHGDICIPESFINKIKELDLVVMLAMPKIVPGRRLSKKKIRELRNETNNFFINSLNIGKKFNIPVILPSGTSYRTIGEQVADETWTIARFGITKIGEDTDEIVNDSIKSNNPRVIQLIFGKIYGNGGLFLLQYEWLKKGRYRLLGGGENFIPIIHADDAAEAIIKLIEKMPIGEKFIITDDESVTMKDFSYFMAKCMGVPKPKSAPLWLLKLLIGKDLIETATMNCKVSNAKAKKYLDWKPQYTTYREGLKAVIKEIEKVELNSKYP